MFYFYTRRKHQKNLDRFIHQISAPKFLLLSLKVLLQKRDMGLCNKLFMKKERKKELKKMDAKVSKISKTMGTQMPA